MEMAPRVPIFINGIVHVLICETSKLIWIKIFFWRCTIEMCNKDYEKVSRNSIRQVPVGVDEVTDTPLRKEKRKLRTDEVASGDINL